jgi:hypothetical protein
MEVPVSISDLEIIIMTVYIPVFLGFRWGMPTLYLNTECLLPNPYSVAILVWNAV